MESESGEINMAKEYICDICGKAITKEESKCTWTGKGVPKKYVHLDSCNAIFMERNGIPKPKKKEK